MLSACMMRGSHGFTCAAAAILITMVYCPNVGAALTAYEGFDYAVGEISGQNGGTGWAAAWAGTAGRGTVTAGGLTYTDASGNQLTVAGNYLFGNGQNGNTDLTRGLTLTNTGTTWMSFIGKRLMSQATAEDSLRRAGSLQFREGTAEKISVGKISQAAPAVPNPNWSIFENGAATVESTADHKVDLRSGVPCRSHRSPRRQLGIGQCLYVGEPTPEYGASNRRCRCLARRRF